MIGLFSFFILLNALSTSFSQIKAYFENAYDLNESLFSGLKGNTFMLKS